MADGYKYSGPMWETRMFQRWMDNRAQKTKHKSCDRQKRESSDENREVYKKAFNIFSREARSSNEKFERKMAENINHDMKSLCSYARSKSRTKHSVAPIMDRNVAFTKENMNSISHPEQMFTGDAKDRLLDVNVSQSIGEMKLNKLNMNKSSGVDRIYPSLLI